MLIGGALNHQSKMSYGFLRMLDIKKVDQFAGEYLFVGLGLESIQQMEVFVYMGLLE